MPKPLPSLLSQLAPKARGLYCPIFLVSAWYGGIEVEMPGSRRAEGFKTEFQWITCDMKCCAACSEYLGGRVNIFRPKEEPALADLVVFCHRQKRRS